jgi:hypothetical protein
MIICPWMKDTVYFYKILLTFNRHSIYSLCQTNEFLITIQVLFIDAKKEMSFIQNRK